MDDPVGVSDIAQRAGVKPDTVQKWRDRHADFPAPVLKLARGPLWEWTDVEDWLARERRPGRPSNPR
jgi:hypothetical protein